MSSGIAYGLTIWIEILWPGAPQEEHVEDAAGWTGGLWVFCCAFGQHDDGPKVGPGCNLDEFVEEGRLLGVPPPSRLVIGHCAVQRDELQMWPTDPAALRRMDRIKNLVGILADHGVVREGLDPATIVNAEYLEAAAARGCGA